MALLTIGRGPSSFNYYVFRDVLDREVVAEVRAAADRLPDQNGTYDRSTENKMFAYLDEMPMLVRRLQELFDDIHLLGSNFFCSSPTRSRRAEHGDWHTGHSLYFGVNGAPMTMWIPLQDLDDETGGRLKIYNGELIRQIDDLLKCQVKDVGNSISPHHSLLKFLTHELERGCVRPNLSAGDILLFDEMLPHQAEKCLIDRRVLAMRVVLGDYSLDTDLIQQVLDRYQTRSGETSTGAAFLANLAKYREYSPPGSPDRPSSDPPVEALPADFHVRRSLLERVRTKLQ